MLDKKKVGMHLLAAIALSASASAHAALIFYTSEAAFDAAAGTTTTQTFAPDNNSCAMLNNTTAGCGVPAGGIAPGLTLTATGGDSSALYGSSAGAYQTNGAIYANFFTETLNLSFAPGVSTVGLGLLSLFDTSDFTVSFFDGSNMLIGSTTVFGVPNGGTGKFFGVIGTAGESIGRINLSSLQDQAEGVDLVKFGDPRAVPEPGTLALLGLGLFGAACSRRRAKV